MKRSGSFLGPNRRSAVLLDISQAMSEVGFAVQAVVSLRLWDTVADEAPFDPDDPRVLIVCRALLLAVCEQMAYSDYRGPLCDPLTFELEIGDRAVQLLAVARESAQTHEPQIVLSLEEENGRSEPSGGKHHVREWIS
jgi:hypothetical protein